MIKVEIYKHSYSIENGEPDEVLSLKEFEKKFNNRFDDDSDDDLDYTPDSHFNPSRIKFVVA